MSKFKKILANILAEDMEFENIPVIELYKHKGDNTITVYYSYPIEGFTDIQNRGSYIITLSRIIEYQINHNLN